MVTVNGNFSDLWKCIIRPPREAYHIADLGPQQFTIGKRQFKRTDIQLKNQNGLLLQCSHFEPIDQERVAEKLPCVIYCHGNCSSRLESFIPASILLPQNITLFSFDFSGCGHSEGDYISLGWHEKEDLQTIINHLRSTDKVTLIGLWGRSMGAVTSILQGSRDTSIAGMVLDSPFSNLSKLSLELVKTHTKIPSFVASIIKKIVRKSVLSRARFDIDKLNPIDYVGNCFIPALFVVAKGDIFVRPHHGQALYEKYAGDKNIIKVEGDHNSDRPYFMLDSVSIFFHTVLQCDKLPQLDESLLKENQFLLKLDQVLEKQIREQSEKTLIEEGFKNEDDEFKRAVRDSLENMYVEQEKEKMLNQFFYKLEKLKDKENFNELIMTEMKEFEKHFDENELEFVKNSAISLQRSESLKLPEREPFSEQDLNNYQ